MAEVTVTWLGDEDPSVQSVEQYGHTFVKGEAVKVPEKDPNMLKFRNNAMFKVGAGKADVVESAEPERPDPDKGTEIEAVRNELDAMHVKYDGRSGLDTLRAKLAEAKAA